MQHYRCYENKLNIVCFKWGTKYSARHVNNLYKQVKRYLNYKFNFYCITDDSNDLDSNIQTYPFWGELDRIKNTSHAKKPLNNFKRLKLYDRKILSYFNYNVLMLDLDVVVCGNIDFLAELQKNSMWLSASVGRNKETLNTSVTRVINDEFCLIYDKFIQNPLKIIDETRRAGWKGTDQAIITHLYKENIVHLTKRHGIISFKEFEAKHKNHKELPEWVKILAFYGADEDPGNVKIWKQYPFIEHLWRNTIKE